MAQIQFSLIKKIKIGRKEHLLQPPPPLPAGPLCPMSSHFYITPSSPATWTSYVHHPLLAILRHNDTIFPLRTDLFMPRPGEIERVQEFKITFFGWTFFASDFCEFLRLIALSSPFPMNIKFTILEI